MLIPLAQAQIQLPQGPHRDLVYNKCRNCHDLQYLENAKGMDKAQWQTVLNQMKTYGLSLTAQQNQQLLDYLSTYLGPTPAATSGRAGDPADNLSGKLVFDNQCSACHQPNGQGLSGAFPPLAENKDLFKSRNYPVYVVLNGLQGPINVEGTDYNSQMPSFDFLSNNQVASVVQYVRDAWGNGQDRPKSMTTVTAKDVAKARQKPMTPLKVRDYRNHTG